jgi:hypothetical protein
MNLLELVLGAFVMLLAVGMLAGAAGSARQFFIMGRERAICNRIAFDATNQMMHMGGHPNVGSAVNYPGYTIGISLWDHYPGIDPRYDAGVNYRGTPLFLQKVTVVSPHGATVTMESLLLNPYHEALASADAARIVLFAQNARLVTVLHDPNLTGAMTLEHTYGPLPVRAAPPPQPSIEGEPQAIITDQAYSQLYVQDYEHAGIVPQTDMAATTWPTSPFYTNWPSGYITDASSSENLGITWGTLYYEKAICNFNMAAPAAGLAIQPAQPDLPLIQPASLTTDAAGNNVWVADPGNLCLRNYNGGVWSAPLRPSNGGVSMGCVRGVALGSSGALYAIDALNLWLSPDGHGASWTMIPLPPGAQFQSQNLVSNRLASSDVLYTVTKDNHMYRFHNGAWDTTAAF